MHKQLAVAGLVCLLAAPAFAQTSTATGTGISNSRSQSRAVAVSRGGSVVINSSPNGTSNLNQNVTGTSTIKNVPSTIAPGLTAAGLETCLGSVSGGASVVGFGASFGTTVPDPGCAARLDARTLWSMGLKKAAVARLCLTPEIDRSMPDVCASYLPRQEYASAESPEPVYTGGPIELVEGKTGKARWCDDYNVAKARCRKWAAH